MTTFLFFKQRKVINTLTEEHVVKGASVFCFSFISPYINIVVTLAIKYFSSKQQMSELLNQLPFTGRRSPLNTFPCNTGLKPLSR